MAMLHTRTLDSLRITCPRWHSLTSRPALHLLHPRCPPSHIARQRRSATVFAAARRDPFEVLGIPRAATMKEVKTAYRKKALKLHPDVNKAPDARDRFMECKNAYQEILERENGGGGSRAGGFGGSSSSSWGGASSGGWGSSTSGGQQQRRGSSSNPPEDFYGLDDLLSGARQGVERAWEAVGDFFNDLEKEWGDYSKRRGGDAGGPKSLWEELADIGEELVEFLEKGAGLGPDGQPIQAKKGSSWEEEILGNNNKDKKTSSPPPRPPPQKQKQDRNSASRPPVTPPKSRKEVIDDDLEELKRKMGLK